MKNQKQILGFTLIELLVVIALIGLLASVIMVAVRKQNATAKATKLTADFKQIQTQIDISRLQNNLRVQQITGSGCSDCAFRDGLPISSHTAALIALNTSWQRLGFAISPVDPWNNPYMMDENEQEGGSADCRFDQVWSAGPDGIDNATGGDDILFSISHYVCQN
jgi:general secretion pathway protein G